MGKKNSNTIIRYETVVQLLLLAAVILTPFLAFNFMDFLELFSVSKTMSISFWSSIKPWLSPSYVYLFINFIIFFIAASSSIRSKTIGLNPPSLPTDSFIESSTTYHNPTSESLIPDDHDHDPMVYRNLAAESLIPDDHDHDHFKFHTLEDTFKDRHVDEERSKEVVAESVADLRELRKSKTFNGGELRSSGRKERYVRILSQEELDRRVEAFIYTFKKKKKESNEGLKLPSIYEPNLA